MRVGDTTMSTIEWALSAESERQRVTSNNIANVNTSGFKSSRATFSETLAQTIRGGGLPTGAPAAVDGEAGNPVRTTGRVASRTSFYPVGVIKIDEWTA